MATTMRVKKTPLGVLINKLSEVKIQKEGIDPNATKTEKIGVCVVCEGDIVKKTNTTFVFSENFRTGPNNGRKKTKTKVFCQTCGLKYEEEVILNNNKKNKPKVKPE